MSDQRKERLQRIDDFLSMYSASGSETDFQVEQSDDLVIVRLKGKTLEQELREKLGELGDRMKELEPPLPLIIDLTGIDFLDSVGVSSLVMIWKKIGRDRLILVADGVVREVFSTINLEKMVAVRESLAEAKSLVQRSR